MPGWWNGRHNGLKIRCSKGREGSSPSLGTNKFNKQHIMKTIEQIAATVLGAIFMLLMYGAGILLSILPIAILIWFVFYLLQSFGVIG